MGYYDEWCPGQLLLELFKYCGDQGVTEPKAGREGTPPHYKSSQ